MHDVITGYYVPSEDEKAAGIKGGFGTSLNIILQGPHCAWDTWSANKRIGYYKTFLTELSGGAIDASGWTDMDCSTEGDFTE